VFSRREKALLALAAVAVVAVACVQLAGTVAGTAGANGGADVARWETLRRQVDDAQVRLRKVTIPGPEAAARLLRAAQASGAATGATIAFARPRAATKTRAGCLEQALDVQATGRFPNIARFMFDLEANNPSLRIARVAVTAADDASDRVNCAITVAGYSPGVSEKWKKNEVASRSRASLR